MKPAHMIAAIALALWPFVGFALFAALHQVPSWPSSARAGYACAIACGPGVWLLLLVWRLIEKGPR